MSRAGMLVALACLVGCGGDPMMGGGVGGAAPTGDAGTDADAAVCGADPCPVGVVTDCSPKDTPATCCQDDVIVQACARPWGILSNECPANGLTCASGLCAVREPTGNVGLSIACCDTPGLPGPDPCDI